MRKIFTTSVCVLMAAAMVATAGVPVRHIDRQDTKVTVTSKQPKRIGTDGRAAVKRTPQSRADEAISVPFTHTLGKDESSTNTVLYSLIDANGDGRTWKIGGFTGYSVCMKPNAEGIETLDDWLVSPGIALKAGVDYSISFEYGSTLTATADKMAVYIGAGNTVADFTTAIVPEFTFNNKTFETKTATFSVDADGTYYLGFHACGATADSGNPKLCNLSVAAAGAPAEVVDAPAAGTLDITVFPKGELKAHVVYTAPTTTQSGAALDHIDKVEIVNRWYEKTEYTDVVPGQVIELDVDLYKGASNNRVEATAYVNDSEGNPVAGESVLVTGIYGGLDTPLAPTNAKATLSADGNRVTVSWDAPGEVGENGGYVDVDNITYYIFDAFGSYYDPAIATTTETSYTFDYSDLTSPDFMAYQITAGVDDYYSLDVATNIVAVGPANELPFVESFDDAYYQHIWVTDPASSYTVRAGTVYDNELRTNADDDTAEPEYLNSQDGDNGFLFILPMEKDDMYGLISEKIDLAGATNPVLEFYYQGKGSVLDVMLAADGADLATVETIDLMENPTDDWTLYRLGLDAYKSSKFIQMELRLRAIHNDDEHTYSVPIDNIRVRDLLQSDLRVASVAVPGKVQAPAEIKIVANIENFGTEAMAAATAELYRDGVAIATADVPALEADAKTKVEFTDNITLLDNETAVYTVTVISVDDMNAGNNSASATVKVTMPSYPTVEDLNAEVNGSAVNLRWTSIDIESMKAAVEVTEDFENPDYEKLTIEGPGEWTVYDGDGAPNYYFFYDYDNPYRGKAMAWQLFNREAAGITQSEYADANPHSGDNFMIAWSCQRYNDNWLISPELSGEAQTISFYAKSFTIGYPESFWVYYSTTDNNPDNFVEVESIPGYTYYGEVPEDWTQYTVSLPEGTKYFAIVHDAYDTYALYLDDITYTAASAVPADFDLVGYNVYRDSELLNDTPVTDNQFVDTPAGEQRAATTYNYRVSAVYNYGESKPCDPVTVDVETTGIESLVNDSQAVQLYTIDGKMVAGKPAPGVYIVRSGNTARKIVIR